MTSFLEIYILDAFSIAVSMESFGYSWHYYNFSIANSDMSLGAAESNPTTSSMPGSS